jgi:HD-GYP domain-containing protein (c-di-GMP phosphodiesterase class II)
MARQPAKNGYDSAPRPWGVRVKLLLSFALLTTISTGVFFWIAFSTTRKMAEDHMTQKLDLLATVFSEEIARDISNITMSMERIAAEPEVREMEYSPMLKFLIGRQLEQARPDAVFIYDRDMHIRFSMFLIDRAFAPHDWIADEKSILRAMKTGESVVFPASGEYAIRGTVFVATPILGGDGDALGAVIGEKAVDVSTMQHIIAEHIQDKNVAMVLIDRRGTIIVHINSKLIGRSAFDKGSLLAPLRGKWRKIVEGCKKSPVSFSFEGKDGEYIGTASLIDPSLGWHVAIVQPLAEAIEPVKKVRNKIIGWGLVAILASIYIALYRARRITKPIGDLIQAVGEIARGDYSKRVRIYRRDEFGALAYSFNRMSAVLQEKIEALQISQIQLEEAYNQLQNDARGRDESNRELSRKVKELTSLSEVTQAISNSLDTETVLSAIVDTINKVMGFEICSIKLLDRETDSLSIEMSRGLGEEYMDKGPTPIGQGISGLAAKMCKPIIVNDLETDQRVSQDHVLRKLGVKSVVSIPLITKQSVMGVLNLYSKEKHEFTEDEMRLLWIFANQAAGAIENARLYDSLRDSYLNTIQALSMAIDAKDKYTHGHSKRVSDFSVAIGTKLGLTREKLDLLKYASDLHDIGKIGISEVIISKEGKLTVDEYEIIKTHPLVGETIIEPVPFLQEAKKIIRYHHERYDGYGYPDGLLGEEIPLLARIIHIADAFDAMTSDRPYRKALLPESAVNEIKKHSGTQFDPKVVEAFLQVYDKSHTPDNEKAP